MLSGALLNLTHEEKLEKVPWGSAHPQPPHSLFLTAWTLLFRAESTVIPFQPIVIPMGGKRSISHQGGFCLTHSKSKCLSHLGKFCYLVCWEVMNCCFHSNLPSIFLCPGSNFEPHIRSPLRLNWESPGVRDPRHGHLPV